MGIEVQDSENEAESIISQAYDETFKDESNEVIETVEEENNDIDDAKEDQKDPLETKDIEDEVNDDSTNEVEEEKEIEEKEIDLNETLRGVFNKDYINLLESVDDLELRDKLINAGKLQRADLDRKRLDLGESNKLVSTLDEAVKANGLNYNRQQYGDIIKNFMGFDALFAKDPRQALETLAKQANIDLNSLNNKAVQSDDEDYRLPEEIARDEKLEALEKKLNQYENQQQQQSQVSVQQEINDFANTKDSEGNLKYPHFDRVRANMGLFFNDNNSDMTMDLAYNKAIRLDDELFNQSQRSLLAKDGQKRKIEIEKAKKLKKQSIHSSNIKTANKTPRKALEDIVADLGFG